MMGLAAAQSVLSLYCDYGRSPTFNRYSCAARPRAR